jgi:hypothetical protein
MDRFDEVKAALEVISSATTRRCSASPPASIMAASIRLRIMSLKI